MQEKRLISTQELAERLGVSERHIYRQMARDKNFPKPYRIGRCLRWDPDDFFGNKRS